MKKALKIILSAFIIFIVSCTPTDTVQIEHFAPEGEVDKLTTFEFEFNKNLAPDDKQEVWLDDEFVEFEPQIPGKFKWVSSSKLIFSPDVPLEPIQEYKARVTREVLFGQDLSTDFEEKEFHTPYFEPLKAEFFWNRIPNADYKMSVQANLYFNYPVVPDRLKNYLLVEKAGEEITSYEIVSDEASEVIALNFGEIKQADKEQEFKITVRSGLESTVGKKPLEEDRDFKQTVPPITRLVIKGLSASFEGGQTSIRVATSQRIDEKSAKNFISIVPDKKYQLVINDNYFLINADLSDSREARVKIKKGLPGLYGGELEFDFEQTVTMVSLRPSIKFSNGDGKYLMYGGKKNVQVTTVNISKADLKIYKVYENNITHFQNQNRYYYDNWYGRNIYVGNFGKEVYSQKLEISSAENWREDFTVSLDSALGNKFRGIYVAEVRSAEDRWIQDAMIVSVSDLAMLAKKSEKQFLVFVNSIESAEPAAGVEVNIISTNNQVITSGISDENGVVSFDNFDELSAGFSPGIITAKTESDFNFIDLNETNVETSRFDVGGITEYSAYYKAYAYGDRNLYRPGETVHITSIIRNDKIKLVQDLPVMVKVITPNGKKLREFKPNLNKESSFEIDFEVPGYAPTGEYVTEIYSGPETLIGTYKFSVEDFVPDQIRVGLNTQKDSYSAGDEVTVNVDAEYLFGADAAGLKYEARVFMNRSQYQSKKYSDYDFNYPSENVFNPSEVYLDGALNGSGEAEVKFTIPKDVKPGGVLNAYFTLSVFDLTGRTVNKTIGLKVFPKDYYIGVLAPGYYYGTGEPITFKIAAVDRNDKPLSNFKGKALLIKYEWASVLKKDYNDRYYYTSEKKETVIGTKDFSVNGDNTKFEFTVNASGEYEIRFYKEGDSGYYTKKGFYAYGWGSSSAASFEVDKEGRIEIVFDKEKYEPGESAKVLFSVPFSGRMLVTVERNEIYSYRYVDIENKSTEIEIPLTEEMMPNAYVTATLFKEHSMDRGTPFLVGHGFASAKVEKKANLLPVTITAPEKIKPGRSQEIKIKTAAEKDVFITLAAVDEGILQIKNYTTPDPYGYMYAKRPLQVMSYDLYKLLLPELDTKSPAGGMEYNETSSIQKRLNPVQANRFKPVSLWSGIKRTNSNGEVTVNLDIPRFNGELRLMAVAYSGSRFGNAEKPMTVSDDLIIQPQVPRFMHTNDSLISPVTVVNTTDKDGSVTVSIDVEGPLSVIGENEKEINVPANGTAAAEFSIKAANEIGVGKIHYETGGIAEVEKDIEIAVSPPSPLVSETGSGTIKAGQTIELSIPQNFMEGTQSTSVTISKFPGVKFAKHLKYLVGYPHGCLEQTVSKLFPQLYFEELAKLAAPELYETTNPVYYVKEGIRKIESMQQYDGSFLFWENGSTTNWWATAYAAHFLIESRKAGFDVSLDVLNNVMDYLSKQAKTRKIDDYYTYNRNAWEVRKIASKEIIYSLYVLAMADKADLSTMNYYKARENLLTNDSRYLLAGAYAFAGNWTSYNELLPSNFNPEVTRTQSGGWFDSEVRANAIMLNTMLDVDPENSQIPNMVKHLSKIAENMWSTQERSWAFLALGKAANKNSSANVSVSIKADGSEIMNTKGYDMTVRDGELNNGKITLTSTGSGEVYYFWNTEGIKINEPVSEEDVNMAVRRYYYDARTKQIITDGNFKQGQLLVCKVTIRGMERSAENIVITDKVPACFEIENPRLNDNAAGDWQTEKPMNPEYTDYRDDRVLLFTDLPRNDYREHYYMIRVVTKGNYTLPVISAEAMYDREFRSYNGAGEVTSR